MVSLTHIYNAYNDTLIEAKKFLVKINYNKIKSNLVCCLLFQ